MAERGSERPRVIDRRVAGGAFHHTIRIWVPVPPEVAFDYVADLPRHAEWAADPIRVESLDPPPVHSGSRFHAVGRQAGRDWPSELVVTACDPPRRLEFTATGGPVPMAEGQVHRHEFVLAPERGGTRLDVIREDPVSGRLVALVAPVLTRFAMGHRLQTIERLRARLAELGPAPAPD